MKMHLERRYVRFLLLAGVAVALGGVAWRYGLPGKPAAPRPHPWALNQDTHAARGFGADSARVDSQITLAIPDDQVDDVYRYLKDRYAGGNDILHDQFPSLALHGQAKSDVSVFTDGYFDTPDLDLYRDQNSARFRSRVNTTDPSDRKSGRRLVQVKVTPPGHLDARSELKYRIRSNTVPGRASSADDRHPLVKLIKKRERRDFKDVFLKAGIDPGTLRPVVQVRQTRSRVYVDWGDTNVISFSVDKGSASFWWAEASFASVDVGMVEIAYTEADEPRRQTIRHIRDAMVRDLVQRFPALAPTSDSKYGIVLGSLIRQLPLIPLLLRWNIV